MSENIQTDINYCKGYTNGFKSGFVDGFKDGYKKAIKQLNHNNTYIKDFKHEKSQHNNIRIKNPCPCCGGELESESVIKYYEIDNLGNEGCNMAMRYYCSCGYEKIKEY